MMESNKTQSQALNEALKQPNGARFYRCALQVNPFAYHGRHGKQQESNETHDRRDVHTRKYCGAVT